MNRQAVLDPVTELLENALSGSVVGIYLHGSMAMGCFNPMQSDIDIVVIVKDKLPKAAYKAIAGKLIRLEQELGLGKGFEISVVLEVYAADFVYPTPFEFHYSSSHRGKYLTDEDYFCGGFDDSDLAAHFVVTYHRGIVLSGKPIKDVFTPVPPEYYIDSIRSDVDGAPEGIGENPVYYVLNLSRVLLYARESVIASKKEAGEWALLELPRPHKDVVAQCLAKYEGGAEGLSLDGETLVNFAKYMLDEMEAFTGQRLNDRCPTNKLR